MEERNLSEDSKHGIMSSTQHSQELVNIIPGKKSVYKHTVEV